MMHIILYSRVEIDTMGIKCRPNAQSSDLTRDHLEYHNPQHLPAMTDIKGV